jgi:hypothetical protein
MIDRSRDETRRNDTRDHEAHDHSAKAGKGTLPAFAPVPRHYRRHDGWTPERQQRFIEALADLGSVRAAAHAVNMTPEGAYHLRRHPAAGGFRKAWEAALACGVQRLEDIAMDRALHGVETPVYSYGKLVGTRRVYNDALLMFMLRNRATKRFSADSLHSADAPTRQQLAKLKRHWRAEWEAEQQDESDDVIASIDAQLDRLTEQHRAEMSDEERGLADALEQARRRRLAQQEASRPALPRPARRAEPPDKGEPGEAG